MSMAKARVFRSRHLADMVGLLGIPQSSGGRLVRWSLKRCQATEWVMVAV
jgi:hypothetical protein